MSRFGKILGIGATLAVLAGGGAATAVEMSVDEARRFVLGKQFSYRCFDGTVGAGRIQHDGSVAGTIQIRGSGQARYMVLPAGTVGVRGQSVCAQVKGMMFSPCFNLERTSAGTFRGSVSGLGFAYCDFNRRNANVEVAARPRARVRSAEALPPQQD